MRRNGYEAAAGAFWRGIGYGLARRLLALLLGR